MSRKKKEEKTGISEREPGTGRLQMMNDQPFPLVCYTIIPTREKRLFHLPFFLGDSIF